MTDEQHHEGIEQFRAVFTDRTEADTLAQAEAMVAIGSGVVHDDADTDPTGEQILLVSPTGCTNYWHPGPEHGADDGDGAYATLMPGVEEAGVGPLRDAALALLEHDRRVAARTGHLTCAARTHPEDFGLDIRFCPCGAEPVLGHAKP